MARAAGSGATAIARSIRSTAPPSRRAAAAIEVIDAAEHRGVATVFIDAERAAAKQVLNGIVQLNPEMFLGGVLGAVFSVPAAAIRAS